MRFLPILLLLSQDISVAHHCTFLPKNDRKIPVTIKNQGLDEVQYHAVINEVEAIYAPIFTRRGQQLQINRLWEHPRVNAGTYKEDNKVIINMYGGFARHKDTTPDGFALVICHEIGHHIGGAPKKERVKWSSTEGQADYFATLKCLRRVWSNSNNEVTIVNETIPALAVESCEKNFRQKKDQAICMRSTLAGMAISKVSSDIRGEIVTGIETPDPNIVETTYEGHPVPQCRLDTYFQGAICKVNYQMKLSIKNEATGTCHEVHKSLSGIRPKCWHNSGVTERPPEGGLSQEI